MSKSWAGVVHSQQRGSDTHRSPASQETREAWCSRVYPTGAGTGLGSRHGERITQEQKRKEEQEEEEEVGGAGAGSGAGAGAGAGRYRPAVKPQG